MSGFYPTQDVREAARGNWVAILATMIPEIEPALKKMGRGHIQCPMPGHGSKGKNFRVFKDVNETGGAICSCGSRKEGFNVLMDYHGWTFEEAKEHIARFLQLEKVVPRQEREQQRKRSKPVNQASAEVKKPREQPAKPVESTGGEATNATSAESENDKADDLQPQPQQTEDESQSEQTVTITDIYRDKPWLAATAEELAEQRKRDELYQAHLVERIEKLWSEALPLDAPAAEPARAYLRNRKLSMRGLDLAQSLRFVPKLVYRDEDGNNLGDFPAIVAAIRDREGELITLHRTYLTKKGKKARVPCAKKMMPVPTSKEVVGGAIRLGESQNGVIGVAEGMETALSVYRATGQTVWSLVSASILQGFEPPEGTRVVVHWADKDRSAAGELADAALRERLEPRGIKVITMLPGVPIPARAKGVDWNDVLIGQGLFGFPRREHLSRILQKSQGGIQHAV